MHIGFAIRPVLAAIRDALEPQIDPADLDAIVAYLRALKPMR